MRAPFSFLNSSGGGPPPFDRASLPATGYWIDYAGAPWVGTASAGTSLGHDLAITGLDPTVGANFGSHPSADFAAQYSGANASLVWGDLISTGAYSFNFVTEIDTEAAPAGAGSEYLDPALVADLSGGYLYVTVTSDGVLAGHYDGSAYRNTTPIPLSTGVKVCVQVKYDGTNLKCRVDGKDSMGAAGWESVAVGHLPGGALAEPVIVGASYSAAGKIDGRIGLAMTFNTAVSDGDMDSLLADARAHFAVP